MEKYLELKENTEFYSGSAEIMESCSIPGMVLIQLWMTDKTNEDRDSAGIRLTRHQARQLGNHLVDLADELYFEEMRSNANG